MVQNTSNSIGLKVEISKYLWILSQPCLHSEFQATQGYTEMLSQKTNKQRTFQEWWTKGICKHQSSSKKDTGRDNSDWKTRNIFERHGDKQTLSRQLIKSLRKQHTIKNLTGINVFLNINIENLWTQFSNFFLKKYRLTN